jgi:hypothetical protein
LSLLRNKPVSPFWTNTLIRMLWFELSMCTMVRLLFPFSLGVLRLL